MRTKAWLILVVFFSGIPFLQGKAQEEITNTLTYHAETFGSVATGNTTPFWMASNNYGVTPIDAGSGLLRGGITINKSLYRHFFWRAGAEAIIAAPREKNIFIQQLYAEIGFQSFLLSIGSKERYRSLYNRNLSSGDMILSTNARPIPEVSVGLPQFTVVPLTKGWLQVKGEITVGKAFESDYLKSFAKPDIRYVKDILWHYKSAFVRIGDTRNEAPFSVAFGIQHIAQWGGESTDPNWGVQPHSLKDFVRVFFGRSGGEDASEGDQINILGSHHLSYEMKLGYTKKTWAVHAYYQHISADKSGLLFYNGTDGLWGVEVDLKRFSPIRKIVAEFITTRNQSGSFHYINFDHAAHPGRGGGDDDYYNNWEYATGSTYFNRSVGSPLLISPEYNTDNELGFKSTRVRDYHLGLEGDLSPQLSYRFLMTVMNGWGTSYAPFLKKKTGTSLLFDLAYTHPKLSDWQFMGSIGADTGNITGKSTYGFRLGIRKQGILKSW
ncbi:capsule assembly Wzi family protein [Parabacteroides sp. OttesenSCG-928-G07]|nr:capsule assembly Wzi family protein [Parabacteroides sp. OttesenSCG-928-G21]MDL2278425.1 capsule assembly Wzi family protein [Parabacteroides sp. OttesenSCG-928-G07]